MRNLGSAIPKTLHLSVVYDLAEFVSESIGAVRDAIVIGAVLAVLILFGFLRDGRTTLVAATSLPLSVIGTFFFLKLFGGTLNLMSLGGLAIAIGLIIDDAVVVIENIYRHLGLGESQELAAERATQELLGAVAGSTATTLVVFLPLGLLQGFVGEFFRALSLTLGISVLLSLVFAVAVIPLLSLRYLSSGTHRAQSARVIERVNRAYERAVRWSLKHRAIVAVAAVVLVVLGVWEGVGGSHFTGQLMCLGAAACYGVAIPYQKKFIAGSSYSGLSLSAAQLLVAAAQLAVVAPLVAGAPPAPVSGGAAAPGRGAAARAPRHWNEDDGRTHTMRSKEEAEDYRYFPEPDLVPVEPPAELVERLRGLLPERPAERIRRIEAAVGFDQQSRFHDLTVDEHTFAVVQAAADRGFSLQVRLAARLHGLGQPPVAWSGPGAPEHPTFPVSQGLTGAAIREKKAVIVGDVRNDPRYLTAFGSTLSEIIVPVLGPVGGRVIGTVDVESERPNAFSASDQQMIEQCAQAALALWLLR